MKMPGEKTVFSRFDDLNDSDLSCLYNTCSVRTFQKEQVVAKNGENGDAVFFIITGRIVLFFSANPMIRCLEFGAGEILEVPALVREISGSLLAAEETRVLAIGKEEVAHFPEKIRLSIERRWSQQFSRIFGQLSSQNIKLQRAEKGLAAYISGMESRTRDTTSSALIQDIIRKIPKLPTFAHDLVVKLHDRNIDTREVVASIQNDPSLASLVLKTVNSAFYGFREKISDVYRAVLLLGFNTIYRLILTQAIGSVMPKEPESSEIQNHSLFISLLSQEIAVLSKKANAPTITTTALLHDIGRIVILLLKRKYPNIRELFELLDTACIGANLLKTWGIPESIHTVVARCREAEYTPPRELPPEYRNEIAILYIAHVCQDLILEKEGVGEIFFDDYMAQLRLPPKSGKEFAEKSLIPALLKHQRRVPEGIRDLLRKAAGRVPIP